MSKKPPNKMSGRAVADEKGNRKWVWDSGQKDIDTTVVKALGEGLSLQDGPIPGSPTQGGANPYDRAQPAAGDATKRRTLDDMRKLSEAIKRSKQKTPTS